VVSRISLTYEHAQAVHGTSSESDVICREWDLESASCKQVFNRKDEAGKEMLSNFKSQSQGPKEGVMTVLRPSDEEEHYGQLIEVAGPHKGDEV
jgi:hypothetical protein